MAFPTNPTDGQIYKSYVFQANIWKKVDPEKLFPVGFIYTQYPGKSDPTTLGWYGTWVNKSSEYAGDFFRTEGGNASSFNGGRQEQSIQPHNHAFSFPLYAYAGATNHYPQCYDTKQSLASYSGNTGSTGSVETRPVNRTIRLWERIS